MLGRVTSITGIFNKRLIYMSIRNLDAKRRKHTLDQLESVEWGPPTYDSYLVRTCHRLRTKPIGEFSVEDLRIMIGQQIGLLFLVPLALEKLAEDPLADGDFYPGDLLNSLLRANPDFWRLHANWKARLDQIIVNLVEMPPLVSEHLREYQRWTGL
jgi:hypothetical protein